MAPNTHEFNLSLGDESWKILEKFKAETGLPKNKIIGRALRMYVDQQIIEKRRTAERKRRLEAWLEEEPSAEE
jgi:hypothetical protein